MKITFPHMGNSWVAAKCFWEYLGLTVVLVSPTGKERLNSGVEDVPGGGSRSLCITLGSFAEAYKSGADTFITIRSADSCRLRQETRTGKKMLEAAGCKYNELLLKSPEEGLWGFLASVKREIGFVSWWLLLRGFYYAYKKCSLVDRLEKLLQRIRCREYAPGTADRIFHYALRTLDEAKNMAELEEAFGLAEQKLLHVPHDEHKNTLRIGLDGEVFALLEPQVNYEIEKRLGRMGVQVERSVYLSEWLRARLTKGIFRSNGDNSHDSAAAGTAFDRGSFDGIVRLAAQRCKSETVAGPFLTQVGEAEGVPVMTIYLDEADAQERLDEKLEKFINLLRQSKAEVWPGQKKAAEGPAAESHGASLFEYSTDESSA